MVVDESVDELYGEQIDDYFHHHGLALNKLVVSIAETDKSLETLEQIVDAFGEFGLLPQGTGPGGRRRSDDGCGRVSQCSAYRRRTNYIRVPTTLIGLIDASVAIKVAVNHRHRKNRLGAYHASQTVILDFSFLSTLPSAQVRNGNGGTGEDRAWSATAACSTCSTSTARSCCEPVSATGTGRQSCARSPTSSPTRRSARCSTSRVPNLHELDLDRVIAYGHTWSPTPGARTRAADAPRSRGQRRHGPVRPRSPSGAATSRLPTGIESMG